MSSLDWLFSLERLGVKFGLDNIRSIATRLGKPERTFRSVHIAGTNGKGSVAAMVECGLRAAGYTTGRFTSPHLTSLTERFAIDGKAVRTATLEEAVTRVEAITSELLSEGELAASPTFFEVTTAVAFEIFRKAGVEVAVIEVGLGGRLDSTNVISPVVSVITTISLDHQSFLGTSLKDIASEKAGIIKPNTPVVIGRLPPEAGDAIREVARQRSASLVGAWENVHIQGAATGVEGTSIERLDTPVRRYETVTFPMAGMHQVDNAVVAIRTLETLEACGVAIPATAARDGLRHVSWPGRLDRRSISGGRELLMDAAHNPEGAAALGAFLARGNRQPTPLVFGALADKDSGAMLRLLAPTASAIVLTRGTSRRFAEPDSLLDTARTVAPHLRVVATPSVRDALETAWRISPRIVVAGSIFLIGDVMKELDLS